MRKHLIGTILVLAALAACNKEVETPAPAVDNGQEEVTPGKVTLTFKATIDDGTRTVYANDKTASWQADDAISVCLSDGTNYEVVDFTTTDGIEFSAEVTQGYEIVSGVYPQNDVYSTSQDDYFYSNGTVKAVYLPDTYNLGTANDGGIALPMVGQMDDDDNDGIPTFKFHHICGALKIEVIDIFDALTFTTAETITGSFDLNSGRIAMPAEGTGSTVTFNYGRLPREEGYVGERENRTFYIPVPDGTLTAGATMALKNANKTSTFFDKTTTAAIEFDSNKIKRLPAIGFNTPQGWSIDVQEVENGNKFKINYNVTSGTYYSRLLISKSEFNESYNGSIACFVEERLPGLTIFPSSSKTYTSKNNIETYFPEKDYYSLMFGVIPSDPSNLDDKTGRKITFEFFKLDYTFEEPTQDYLAWIGKWTVNDGTNTDTWTISRKQANQTYSITGICGRSYVLVGDYYNGDLSLSSQKLSVRINSKDSFLYPRRKNGNGNYVTDLHIISMSMDNDNNVIVDPDLINSPGGYGIYTYNPETNKYGVIARREFDESMTITMTRVTTTE